MWENANTHKHPVKYEYWFMRKSLEKYKTIYFF